MVLEPSRKEHCMKKKIYVVKKGRAPGIYYQWGETEEQVKGFSGAEYRSFTYMTEKEEEDETVEMSLSYALKQAKAYLGEFLEKPKQAEKFLEKEYDEKTVLKKELEYNQEILEQAGLESDSYGNSPWVTAILKYVSAKTFINGETYTGRYSCTSLYTALLYLTLDEDKILETYQLIYEEKQEELPGFEMIDRSIQDIWNESEDYIKLKAHFEEFGMEAIDLPEILSRNQSKAKTDTFLGEPTESYMTMKQFIKQGEHTVMGLYRELVSNPVYRQELLEISGPFRNPDLETKETNETKASMQYIIMQTGAIKEALDRQIIGQNDVIDKFEKSYFHIEKMINAGHKKKGPRHAYLFTGPSGVGKTFMAEIIADTLNIPYKRFDMSGYVDQHTVTELTGNSTLYKDSKPGVLTKFVKEHPRCVLLFDEIEKACKEVILLFLQILDEGKCNDKHYDKDINFQNTIVILTTNAGKQLYQDAENENLTLLPDTVIIDALKKDTYPGSKVPFFPPEIISRMSSHTVIMFNHLRADAILKIIKKDLDKQLKLLKEEYGYDIEDKDGKLAATVLYSMGSSMDARNATVLAGKLIDSALLSFLTLTEEKMGLDWCNSIRKIIWKHDFSGTTDEIWQFYSGEKCCVIAVFGQVKEIPDKRLTENNVQIKATTNLEEFMQILRKENVILTAIDYECGMEEKENNLSIVNIRTEGSKVFSNIRKEYGDIPVYILYGDKGYSYSPREKRELFHRGTFGFIHREKIQIELPNCYTAICFQKTMETLSLRHQRLTYDLRNELDEKQKSGRIVFCNFKLEPVVEAEDKDLLLSADMQPNTHWDDICVSEKIKDELNHFINFLKNPKKYIQAGFRIPKGVLMYGPPGTGKTSLARVVATESGVSFLEIGADVLSNKGADEVRRVFRTARKYAPAVLFIDEVDAIGTDRQLTNGNATLNALLTEMDGFKKINDKPIFIMAATNLKKQIDHALERRFDIAFEIGLPNAEGRKWMLKRLIREQYSDMFDVSDEEIDSIVHRSENHSFADIENMIQTALREAFRAGKLVDDILLDEAFESIHGEARKVSSLETMKRTAYHESGHALIQLSHNRIPDYMSIVARGQFGGYVTSSSSGEYFTKESLLEKICECLGGRAAEMVCGYGITPGAATDLQQATELATWMVCSLGMYEEEVGLAVISQEKLAYNEKVKNLINQILSEQLQRAKIIINDNRDALERLVKTVMDSEKKYLTKKEIEAVYNRLDKS